MVVEGLLSAMRLSPLFFSVMALAFTFTPWGGAAAPEAGQTMVYDIHLEGHGTIGHHKVSFEREGDDLVVEIENEIKVKILFVTAFRFEATRRERWRDGKMITYDNQTHDDGTDIAVRARAKDDKLIIEGPNGTAEAPLGTFPSHPWNKDIVKSDLLMESKTGKLLNIGIASAGAETLQIGDRAVVTTRYEMNGDLERELWFDEEGNWVQLPFVKDGSRITFTLR